MKIRDNRLDLIKIICSLLVIVIHLSASKWYVMDVDDYQSLSLIFFNSFARVSVPIFLMITGVFMMDPEREITYKIIIKKYLFKLILIYFIWSSIFAFVSLYFDFGNYDFKQLIIQFVYRFIKGPVHFWYIYTLFGLYLITPILRTIFFEKQTRKAFIILSIISFSFYIFYDAFALETVKHLFESSNFHLVLGYPLYFLIGRTIFEQDKEEIGLKKLLPIFFVITFGTFLLTLLYSKYTGELNEFFLGYLSPNIIISSSVFFLFLLKVFKSWNLLSKENKILRLLADNSLGVFIIHQLVIIFFDKAGLLDIEINVLISIPILTFSVYIISFLLSNLISKIPIIKEFV